LSVDVGNYREPVTQKFLTEAVKEYVATKQREHEQDLLSDAHMTHLPRDLEQLKNISPAQPSSSHHMRWWRAAQRITPTNTARSRYDHFVYHRPSRARPHRLPSIRSRLHVLVGRFCASFQTW